MPVLVTAADQPLAHRIAARLLDEGGEVRVFGPAEVAGLRAAGAFVATGSLEDEGRLEAALEQVHTLVHTEPAGWETSPAEIVEHARVLATAAGNAGVHRIVVVSLPGAAPDATEPHRRAASRAEDSLTGVACPTVVIRSSLVDTPELRDALATGGLGAAALATEVAPVRADELVELVVAFDRARSRSTRGTLLVRAEGPVRLSVAAYLDRVGVARPGRGSLVGRRLLEGGITAQLTQLLEGPWWTDDDAVVDGWSFAGLTPSPPGPDG